LKLDATEVASAELIGCMDLSGTELISNTWIAGSNTRRAQRRRVDVGGAELSGGSTTELVGGAQRAGGVWT
jgi:hypothetical protein